MRMCFKSVLQPIRIIIFIKIYQVIRVTASLYAYCKAWSASVAYSR